MVSTGLVVYFYVLAFLILTVPLVAILFLKKKYDFPLIKIFIVGVAGNILISSLAIPATLLLIQSFTSMAGMPDSFWENHYWVYLLMQCVVSALLQAPLLYLVFKHVLKGNLRIYDAIATGATYFYFPCVSMGLSLVSYARIAGEAAKDNLASLVNDSITLEELNDALLFMTESSPLVFIAQFLNQCFAILGMIVVLILVYHGLKTQNFRFVWIAVGVNFAYVTIINFVDYLVNANVKYSSAAQAIPVILTILICSAGAIYFIRRYFRWYFEQREKLIRDKQDYKSRLKS